MKDVAEIIIIFFYSNNMISERMNEYMASHLFYVVSIFLTFIAAAPW